jgi:hypothetical protein
MDAYARADAPPQQWGSSLSNGVATVATETIGHWRQWLKVCSEIAGCCRSGYGTYPLRACLDEGTPRGGTGPVGPYFALRITIASSIDGLNSASATYTVSWEGCDASTEWFWNKFAEAATLDNFGPLPVSSREQFGWMAAVRKENNSIRVILYEKNALGTW